MGIDPEKKVLLGFSGGPDSLCLLHLLHETGFQVIAAHLDHGLRPSSAAEAENAKSVCQAYGMECLVNRVDVVASSREHHLTLEESARVLRYEFLFEEAERLMVQAVLVAHNADDQVETVLMHLMRGSGLSGLAGMRPVLLPNPWSNTIPLVRPLIGIRRVEIEDYLRKWGLVAVVDESNTDKQYFRNRIRHELIPYMETYNPRFRERIRNLADVAAVEDDFLRVSLDEIWVKAVRQQGDHFLIIDRDFLLNLHPALLRRFTRQAIEWMDPTLRDIDFKVINRATGFCRKPTRSNRVDLLAGIELFLYNGDLVFARVDDPLHGLWPQLQAVMECYIPVPGELMVSPVWVLQAYMQDETEIEPSAFVAYLDANKLTGGLLLDRVNQGDRFTPYGGESHTKKVGDFWTSEGLPARARKNWPLIRAGGEIIWIPGFRIANHVRVDETTTEVIRLEMKKRTGSD